MQVDLDRKELASIREGILPSTLVEKVGTKPPNIYCPICGDDDCKDMMAHIEDEELMHQIMGFDVCHPDGFCRLCGSCQTIYEMDTDGYECDDPECEGILKHPAYYLGII